MKCPKCKHIDLKATRLETGLPAAGCTQCEGALVTLLYYRDWADNYECDEAETQASIVTEDLVNSWLAVHCPKCSRLMTRYRISGEFRNSVDVCPSCDEAWLDGGEWALLKALQLANKMPMIFTEAWQRKIRREATDAKRRQILAKSIGVDAVDKVEAFKDWLDSVNHKNDVLLYLNKD